MKDYPMGPVNKEKSPAADNPFSLIHYAVQNNAPDSVRYLADKMPLNKKTESAEWFEPAAEWVLQTPALPIDLALREGAFAIVDILLQKAFPPSSPGLPASFIPNKCSNPAVVERIIKAGQRWINATKKGRRLWAGSLPCLIKARHSVTEYGEEMGAYEPPDAKTEAELCAIQKLLKEAGARDLGKKGSCQFWMGSDLESGMFY